MAFYGANLIGDPSLGPANGAVLLPSLLSRTEAPLIDGPAGREDCLLMVRVMRGQAARAASLLRTCHVAPLSLLAQTVIAVGDVAAVKNILPG